MISDDAGVDRPNGEDFRRRYLADLEDRIAELGYALEAVSPRAGDSGPGWVYTIGLHDKGLPELVVIGMSLRVARRVINQLVTEVTHGERDWPAHGSTLHGLLGEYELRVVDVGIAALGDDDDWLLGALSRRSRTRPESPPLRGLQLVWQDEDFGWRYAGTEEQPLLGTAWWSNTP